MNKDGEEYKFKFMLDYGCNCLWGFDEKTQNKYGYHIEDLTELGLSKETIKLNDLVDELNCTYLNPIYQGFPSFWSGEMHKYFQSKVTELYKNIEKEVGNLYEIILHESSKDLIEKEINMAEINNFIEDFIANPIKYIPKGIYIKDEIIFKKEITEEYNKWKEKEKRILVKNSYWNISH